jgi:serine protease inhibitor
MQPVDASRQINSWVAEATNNLIESIVGPDSVSKDTQLVVTNALYFKGRWETPFHKSKTMDHEFHRMDSSAIDAQFMSSDKDQFIAVHDGFKVLKMPYETMLQDPVHGRPPRSYSMFVFLPDARDGLWSLEDRIASSLGFISDHLPKKPAAIGEFRVPKFKLSSASIAKVLQNLGITTVFTIGKAPRPRLARGFSWSVLAVRRPSLQCLWTSSRIILLHSAWWRKCPGRFSSRDTSLILHDHILLHFFDLHTETKFQFPISSQ